MLHPEISLLLERLLQVLSGCDGVRVSWQGLLQKLKLGVVSFFEAFLHLLLLCRNLNLSSLMVMKRRAQVLQNDVWKCWYNESGWDFICCFWRWLSEKHSHHVLQRFLFRNNYSASWTLAETFKFQSFFSTSSLPIRCLFTSSIHLPVVIARFSRPREQPLISKCRKIKEGIEMEMIEGSRYDLSPETLLCSVIWVSKLPKGSARQWEENSIYT